MFCKPKTKNGLVAAVLTTCITAGASFQVQAMESIHFLIPGGAGGGWDTTARGTGEALSKAGLVDTISYENMS